MWLPKHLVPWSNAIRSLQWQLFWSQVAIASLMTYMVMMNHDWHDCAAYGGPIPDELPCLDCGAGL